jgi:flagellar biogenesis protein FliO
MSARKNAPKAQQKFAFAIPGFLGCEPARSAAPSGGLLARLWRWFSARFSSESTGRRLRVTATVPLGEKRFVAVVKVDGREFLVGGGAGNVALLSPLNSDAKTFSELLSSSVETKPAHTAARTKKRTRQSIAETAQVVKKQSSRRAGKPAGVGKPATQSNASRSVRMPRLSAQLNVAPALGHFIQSPLKNVSKKTQSKSKTQSKTNRKTRKQA